MDERARNVLRQGNHLFSKKANVNSLWQEIALNFYPERADFTSERSDGEEYSDHLYSSYPVIARRELGNLFAAALRPRSRKWFSLHVENDDLDEGDEERSFLEYIRDVQWRAMYDAKAGLVRATKQTDHDFAAFGNGVIKYGLNSSGDGLLFRNHHLRDCAWMENGDGAVDCLHRKWKPTASQLAYHFPKTISNDVKMALKKEPYKEFECRHVVMPSRLYDYKSPSGKRYPYISLYVECESETVLEEVGVNHFGYVVPRWHTVSGSQYATSMATSIILPDGRTMQVMTRTMREAGEKFVDPPMIAFSDAIRGDIALYAGGVTIADVDYDEKSGEVLRPINQDRSGMPIGLELALALKEDIRQGFFLDKVKLPEAGQDMTAFEFGRRLEEQIRAQSPIFEPIELEYNDPLCQGVFELMRDNGAFPMDQMPETLSGQDVNFTFRSPLAEMAEQQEAEIFVDVMSRFVLPAAEQDPAQLEQVNLTNSLRDAMRSAGWKSDWFNPIEAVEQRAQQLAKQAQMQAGAEAMATAGQIAEQGGKGVDAMKQAGIVE